MCLSAFLTCKDTQHRRVSPVINFRFSTCYTWDKTRFLSLLISLSSRSQTLCRPHWLRCCVSPQGFDICWSLCLECFSPQICMASFFTSSRSLVKCHLLWEAFRDYTYQKAPALLPMTLSSFSSSLTFSSYVYLIFIYLPYETVSSNESRMIVCSVHCYSPSTNSGCSIDTY